MITIFKIFEKFNDKSKNYSYTIGVGRLDK
jgi:hypothetical protein